MLADPTVTPVPPAAGPQLRVLVADDEESMRHFLSRGLRRLGYSVDAVGDGGEAVGRWQQQPYDLGVFDLRMPKADGLQALGRIRSTDPHAQVVLMTAHGSVESAVEAMHSGAADFVTKPFTLEELQVRLQRALQLRATQAQNEHLRAMLAAPDGGVGLCARSPAMQEVLRQIELLSHSTATVLLTGESGTGKGLVAKALHLRSARAEHPFVALNCAAVPDTLLESELFGHEPGAFTGARTRKLGLLQRADRGTLFLDEIGDLSASAQAKIERFLADREFVPLGGHAPVTVDVRVLAATNRDLPALVQSGAFRPELMYRLDVVALVLPPLRDRREDVAPLIARCLAQHARPGQPVPRLSPDALAALSTYHWPGNVRELENVVERMVVLAGSRAELGVGDLPAEVRGDLGRAGEGPAEPEEPGRSEDYEAARQRFDRIYFATLLRAVKGSVTAAAQRAGMSRGHLHRRLRELGLDAEAARHPTD